MISVFQGTFPEPGCDLCYSSCAVCPTRSWKDRKNDLENYFMYVIGDYRTAALCLAKDLQEQSAGIRNDKAVRPPIVCERLLSMEEQGQ
ncbi:hypothetical protein JOQ06_018421 [Pogonophryne albipinna]|uniref:Uncharacterized protein n=1 Tax=Pogonophryne albipinna TaxID=1090488 RepID=A0AAD6AHW3_9TELE|nr:hypothetical protein JOQ06_018421 [Pogonophryne albipinna]